MLKNVSPFFPSVCRGVAADLELLPFGGNGTREVVGVGVATATSFTPTSFCFVADGRHTGTQVVVGFEPVEYIVATGHPQSVWLHAMISMTSVIVPVWCNPLACQTNYD